MATRAGLAVLGALWATPSGCRGNDSQAVESPHPAVGLELEAFSFTDAAGRRIEWSPGAGMRTDSGEARVADALVIHVFQPDCPACREQARALERLRTKAPPRTSILGIAHRLASGDVEAFSADTSAGYPLLLGTGSTWADHWSRGDSLYIVDRRGAIAYGQVGFHPSDVDRWRGVLEDLAAGRAARYSGPARNALVVGEGLPEIELPLLGGQASARLGLDEQGTLVVERSGERRRFRAAIGFFSRY
jgi:hypothetical protein